MEIKMIVHGTPRGRDIYGADSDTPFIERFYSYIDTTESYFSIEVRNEGAKRYCYYTWFDSNCVSDSNGRPGAYMALTLRFEGYYYKRASSIYDLLKNTFKNYCVGRFVEKKENGEGFRFLISSFQNEGATVKQMEKSIIDTLSAFAEESDFEPLNDAFNLSSGKVIQKRLAELSNDNPQEALKQVGKIKYSSVHVEKPVPKPPVSDKKVIQELQKQIHDLEKEKQALQKEIIVLKNSGGGDSPELRKKIQELQTFNQSLSNKNKELATSLEKVQKEFIDYQREHDEKAWLKKFLLPIALPVLLVGLVLGYFIPKEKEGESNITVTDPKEVVMLLDGNEIEEGKELEKGKTYTFSVNDTAKTLRKWKLIGLEELAREGNEIKVKVDKNHTEDSVTISYTPYKGKPISKTLVVKKVNQKNDPPIIVPPGKTLHKNIKIIAKDAKGNKVTELVYGQVYTFETTDPNYGQGGLWNIDIQTTSPRIDKASITATAPNPSERNKVVVSYTPMGGEKVTKDFAVKKPNYTLTLKLGDNIVNKDELEVGKIYTVCVNDLSPKLGTWYLDGVDLKSESKDGVSFVRVNVNDKGETQRYAKISYLPYGWKTPDKEKTEENKIKKQYDVKPNVSGGGAGGNSQIKINKEEQQETNMTSQENNQAQNGGAQDYIEK